MKLLPWVVYSLMRFSGHVDKPKLCTSIRLQSQDVYKSYRLPGNCAQIITWCFATPIHGLNWIGYYYPGTMLMIFVPSYGENGQCTQKKYISLSPLLAQCRSEMPFFFFLQYTPSLRVCMERRRKRHSHSCTVPGVGRGKCIFSGRIVRFLHMGVS